MRLDWENDGRLWFTKAMPLDQKEGQLVVFCSRTCEFECVSPRREEPFDTLTAAQEWCEANDPANQPKAVEPVASPVEADPLLVEAKQIKLDIAEAHRVGLVGRQWALRIDSVVSSVIARFEAGTIPKDVAYHSDEEFQQVIKQRDGWHMEHDRTAAAKFEARRELATLRAAIENDFWIHMGDGTDHPESLTCRVVMTADQYRELMARPVISDSVKPKEVASPAVQPQFVKGQPVLCVDDSESDGRLTRGQRSTVGDVFDVCVILQGKGNTNWNKSRFRALTAQDQREEEKPKFVVGQKVRVIPGMVCGNMLADEIEHVCSAVHDGRIEIDDIRMQWDDGYFEVVEETVIIPWESHAEVPLNAWFSQGSVVWERISEIYHGGRGYVNIGERICSMKDLFNDGWLYTLDPHQDPPVVHRCGKPMQKG